MWNASYVQKHSNYYIWQELVGEKTREWMRRKLSPKSMLDEISWQIATAVQKLWNLQKRDAGSGLSRLPLTRNEKWRRYADWRPNLYHQIKWVSSLVAVPNGLPLPPALKWILKLKTAVEVDRASRRENRNPNEQQKTTSSGRSFTSVVHTHTRTLLSPSGEIHDIVREAMEVERKEAWERQPEPFNPCCCSQATWVPKFSTKVSLHRRVFHRFSFTCSLVVRLDQAGFVS